MKLTPRSALLAAALVAAGCATRKVGSPPPPPAFDTSAASATRPAPEEALVAPPPAVRAEAPGAPAAPAESVVEERAAAQAAEEPAAPEVEDPPLGWIAGQPLEAEELLVEWGDFASRELWLVVEKLVAARLALAEAGRLGIKLAPEAVERRYEADRAKLAAEVARKDESLSLEEFIERELGFEPARYLERVRRATIRQMLAERAVRAGSLASESVALRLIVVANDEQRAQVEAALAAGREFGEVAQELSVDDSREQGGFVPFVVPQERSPLARLAFQTEVGETAGPLPIGEHQFWIRVEERRAAIEGDWSTIEDEVEASLQRHPVADAEYVNWKLVVEGRYSIDLGPLWSLTGASR